MCLSTKTHPGITWKVKVCRGKKITSLPAHLFSLHVYFFPLAEYLDRYGTKPVWEGYRRNHKGAVPPQKTRKTCIVKFLRSIANVFNALHPSGNQNNCNVSIFCREEARFVATPAQFVGILILSSTTRYKSNSVTFINLVTNVKGLTILHACGELHTSLSLILHE